MIKANIHEAKTNLSKLIEAAERGETVVISRAGKPAVTLTPMLKSGKPKRQFGFLKGQIHFAPDYDQADAEIERDFLASRIFPEGDV
ncbi:type II toxin-antitoxin system prevent-host-death family antitoxin [Ferrovibrio terrae]|jgi:prevent-host-death family protein|uniref:type II toxin-antitoxin system Phd/YefM family antitoxin n=1 Tax=Ferrovibrio terrae TaxID=2594003 RepID=UPI0031381A41